MSTKQRRENLRQSYLPFPLTVVTILYMLSGMRIWWELLILFLYTTPTTFLPATDTPFLISRLGMNGHHTSRT